MWDGVSGVMWELQRVWWTDSDANWRKTHILTSWVKFWGEMSPQCGLSCGHLPPRTSPIWIYLTPSSRTDQHHHNQHSLQLLSISSHFWPGETTEIKFFFFFTTSQQKHWMLRRGPAVTFIKTMLNFVQSH